MAQRSAPLVRRSATAAAVAALCGGVLASAAEAGHAKSARPVGGGYYVGSTASGKPATADVSPDGKQVSAAQFTLACGGQTTQAALQNITIHKSHGTYSFSGAGDGALLFMPSSLSEMGHVSVTGKFVTAHKIKGTFRVQSATCGDTGSVKYRLKLKRH